MIIGDITAPTLIPAIGLSADAGAGILHDKLFVEETPGTEEVSVVKDATIITTTNPSGYYAGTVRAQSAFLGGVKYKSLQDSVLTIDQGSGKITKQEDGVSRVIAHLPSVLDLAIDLDVTTSQEPEVITLSGWNTGSLAKSVADEIDGLLSGVAATESTKKIFDGVSYNPQCWAAGYDWSGLSSTPKRAGTAVTARHVLSSAHFPFSVGTVLSFLTEGGIVSRTVVARALYRDDGTIGESGPWSALRDWCVGVLDSDLPATAKVYKVVGDPLNYLAEENLGFGIPIIALDKEKKALVLEWFGNISPITGEANNSNERATHRASNNETRGSFYEELVGGDSSEPIFLPVSGELMLFACHTYNNSCLPFFRDVDGLNSLIQAADTAAGINTGYTIQTADLSGFTDFS